MPAAAHLRAAEQLIRQVVTPGAKVTDNGTNVVDCSTPLNGQIYDDISRA